MTSQNTTATTMTSTTSFPIMPRAYAVWLGPEHRTWRTVTARSHSGFLALGAAMADKSPRQHLAKKAGKSIKEKRAEKHAKADAKNHLDVGQIGKK